MRSIVRVCLAVVGSAAVFAGTATTAVAAEDVDVLLDYAGTKSIDIGSFGQVFVARDNGGQGPVQLKAVWPDGDSQTVATLPAGFTVGAASVRPARKWVLYGPSDQPDHQSAALWSVDRDGNPSFVRDLAAYQARHPDPYDVDGDADASNPYDLEAMPDGSVLVVDAQHNALTRTWPKGFTRTVACFPTQTVSTDGVPIPDLPPNMPAESVPTGVSLGPDGYAYVSELRGFPFAPGSSRVWRIDPDARAAGCNGTVGHVVRPGVVVARGFNGINDVAAGADGSLYVLELNRNGVLAAEEAFADPSTQQGMGRLTHITADGERHELAAGALSFPGGVAVNRHGAVFVTDMFLFGGPLLRIR